ncbi:MAG: LytTR family transcriptional regulator DNA-binding domain-containing protein [Clostridia bacterium]|nr:LytTR family transcriptional regulator DNA-binding domain-containing protein [Clostridia bacterium]
MEVKKIGQTKTKENIVEVLETNSIVFSMTKCGDCERICISLGDEKDSCCNSALTVQTCNKDIYKVYHDEILYIAIEDRKSVLYLTDRKIETYYHINHWKEVLDKKVFVQPHYSYIVNLNYVDKVTKDFVKIKYGDKEYSVYTSSRKIGAFRKAFLKFGEQ